MSTEFSAFAPPALGEAAPPPGGDSAVPVPVPTLPTLPSPEPPAPPPAPIAPVAPVAPVPTTAVKSAGPGGRKRRVSGRAIVAVLAGLVLAAGLGYGWLVISTPDESSTSTREAPDEPAPTPDIEPEEVSSPLVVPIDEASDVVAEINDNSSESEALELLGLDETGNVIAPGYRFTWSYGTGDTATVTVDATTGDYSFGSSDGLEWRSVDGTAYARRSTLPWSEVDTESLESVNRLGLDGPITLDDLIDPITADYASSTMTQPGDATRSMTIFIDATAYQADHPEARLQWLALLGLPNTEAEVPPGSIITIDASVGTDGRTLESFTVRTATRETGYVLDEVFDTAPVIEAPAI